MTRLEQVKIQKKAIEKAFQDLKDLQPETVEEMEELRNTLVNMQDDYNKLHEEEYHLKKQKIEVDNLVSHIARVTKRNKDIPTDSEWLQKVREAELEALESQLQFTSKPGWVTANI